MVTLKRETNTENRYGGYKTRFSDRMADTDRFSRYAEIDGVDEIEEDIFNDESYNVASWNNIKGEARIQDGRQRSQQREEYIEDYLPANQRKSAQKASISFKGKCLIALYAAVILLFTVLIVTNSLSINAYAEEISRLESQIEVANTDLNEKLALIPEANAESIQAAASQMGMVVTESSTGYGVIAANEGNDYVITTNLFDRICDVISGLFGG